MNTWCKILNKILAHELQQAFCSKLRRQQPHLLEDLDGLLVLLQLGGVRGHFQQTLVSRAETKNQGRVRVAKKNDKAPQRTFTRSSARDSQRKSRGLPFIIHHKTVRPFHHTSQNCQNLSSHDTKLSQLFITWYKPTRTFHHMTQIYQNLSSHTNLSEPFITYHKIVKKTILACWIPPPCNNRLIVHNGR